MSTETNKATARLEAEQFEGRGILSIADEVMAPNYQLHFAGFPTLDREGHKQVIEAFGSAFPDLKIVVTRQVADGDYVANHISLSGTHEGNFQGVPATGRAVAVTGLNLMRFENDKLAELWGYLDTVGLMQQIGAMPSPEPAAL
jgi:steroid delta-isomerase-like uncharacterized protein